MGIFDKKQPSNIQLIEPDYDGIAKVLKEFRELYRVCENTALLDKLLNDFCTTKTVINN
tara:strand:+ start:26177 stop:26353 length:177 start_codon:yes stop_codon:yes gene_type:complete